MEMHTTRRGFFRAVAQPEDASALRPPGFDPIRFSDLCRDCDECVAACPEGIIGIDAHGRARLDISETGCTFCGDCAEACPKGALSKDRIADWPWQAEVVVTCLSLNGVMCRSCQDVCGARAIRFELQRGGRAIPRIDPASCTGCGDCVSSCPVDAVQLARTSMPEEAHA